MSSDLCRRVVSAGLLMGLLAGCGGGGSSAESGESPTLRTVAQERALVKSALLTAKDLGPPWVAPSAKEEKERSTGKDNELCPGQLTDEAIVPARAAAKKTFTAGTEPGVAIAVFSVRTLHLGQEKAWRAAVTAAIEGCRTYRDENNFFVTTKVVADPVAVPGADEVVTYIERIYEDIKHTKLLYVRQYVQARTGRLISTCQYAVVQPKSDPTGSDLTKVTSLVTKQAKKAAVSFKEK